MADVEFRFSNFKSFRDARLPLAPLTVMIGANASGKSNAIEGIEMLSWLAQGRRLGDLYSALREQELRLRGALPDLITHGSDNNRLKLGCQLASESRHQRQLRLEIELEWSEVGLKIVGEQLGFADESVPLYNIVAAASEFGSEVQVEHKSFTRGRKPRLPAIDSQAIFTQLITPARFRSAEAQDVIPRECRWLADRLSGILFLESDPRRMREYSFQSDSTLRGDGANLSAVLFRLHGDPTTAKALLQFVRSLPEQNIQNIGFIRTDRSEVMVQLTESFGTARRKVAAPSLSDGTLRVLAIAAALLSVPEGSTVVIEEIDNGVHPSRARELVSNIARTVHQRKLTVLLTTHNPALLDALPDRALPDVVACYRDPEQGDSRLVRLGDLSRYPELVAQGSLGELVTRGILDRTLKTSDEARHERDLAWLSELRAAHG